MTLTASQQLKLHALADGLHITDRARNHIGDAQPGVGLSSGDYASTSGVILKLEDDVWVNAPTVNHNANFTADTQVTLDLIGDKLVVRGYGLESLASYCLQPQFHRNRSPKDRLMELVVSHGDRARLSPLNSCAMTCTFCNIPYDSPLQTYRLEPIDECIEALRVAVEDPVQPAQHIMISGGTPKPKDIGNHRELYVRAIEAFPGVPVDIMMVPVPGILDVSALKRAGVNELSINLEVFDPDLQRRVARQKFNWGRDYYLDFIEGATEELGQGRVRSMLMVGLEPIELTLNGVRAIAERGGVPVLSPFRPDPATPLAGMRPSTYEEMLSVLHEAEEILSHFGTELGPSCPPCSHNTISFPQTYTFHSPVLL